MRKSECCLCICNKSINPIMSGLILVAIIAATQSTAAANINAGVGVIMRDVYKRFLKPNATPEEMLKPSRTLTVIYGAIAIGFSLWWQYGAGLALAAFTGFTFAIFPSLMGSLFLKNPSNQAATISIILGLMTSLYWGIFSSNWMTIAHTVFVTTGVSISIYVIISIIVKQTGPWWRASSSRNV
ncbi:MAG: hypothetical protein SCJ93_08435 [Bacillota bacterium]|nr:hypothetical protein [Bacillota bacterium]